jgi:hypothetical protein
MEEQLVGESYSGGRDHEFASAGVFHLGVEE